MNEVTILNTVFTVKTSGLDTVTSPEERKKKKHIRIQRPHDFGFIAYSNISTLENGFKKLWIRMPDSSDTCGRKPYLKRKSCGFKNIWIRVERA